MTVRVTIEFKNVDEAIFELGKLSSAAVPLPAPAQERKPRSDRGKERQPYGPRGKNAGGATATPTTAQKPGDGSTGVTESRSAGATTSPAPASSTVPAAAGPAASAVPGTPGAAQAGSTTAPPAPDPKSVVQTELLANTTLFDGKQPTEQDVAAANEKLAAARGIQAVIDLLARFGVQRARDIAINRRGEYIQRAGEVAAGAAI